MQIETKRRASAFRKTRAFRNAVLAGIVICTVVTSACADKPIQVVVWDEQQPKQKTAYDNFLGNAIAEHLKKHADINVRSMRLDDAEQGLSDSVLDFCQVLIWWGHARQDEITPEKGREIVQRIKNGQLSLIALHSAHWSTPFVEAMNEVTRSEAERRFPDLSGESVEIEYVAPPRRYFTPKLETPLSPAYYPRKYPERKTIVTVNLPNCCFPGYRPDGKPSFLNVVNSRHPIVEGVPADFQVSGTEMYNEPFHVPDPGEVIFEERWPTGEWFRSGMVWDIGKGKVFYFRPGHETFPVFKEEVPLRIVTNAVRWLAESHATEE